MILRGDLLSIRGARWTLILRYFGSAETDVLTSPLPNRVTEWMHVCPVRYIYVAYCLTYVLPMCAACSVHVTYLDLIVLTVLYDRKV